MANINIDFTAIQKYADQIYDAQRAAGQKYGVPDFLSIPMAHFLAGSVWIGYFVWQAALQLVIGVGAKFATSVLSTIGQVRQSNAADFNEVIAASLSELLGTEVDAASLPGGQGPGANLQRMQAIGAALHDVLASEMLSGGPVTPEQGKANAEKFSGFGINFATASAFIAVLCEATSVGFIKDAREIGEMTAQAIGLGRLQRLALEPLIKNAVQTPYDRYYMNQLRPTLMSESQLVTAYRQGFKDQNTVQNELAQKGYSDGDIAILLDQLTQKISAGDLYALIRFGVIDEQTAITRMQNLGMDSKDAQLELLIADQSRADAQVGTIVSNLVTARVDGYIDQETFTGLLGDLPLGDEETTMIKKRAADELERPRTTISFAQLKTAVTSSIVDFSYVDTWLQNKGYSDQDQLILTYEIIEALATADQKASAKAATAAKLQAQGKTVPAVLTS